MRIGDMVIVKPTGNLILDNKQGIVELIEDKNVWVRFPHLGLRIVKLSALEWLGTPGGDPRTGLVF